MLTPDPQITIDPSHVCRQWKWNMSHNGVRNQQDATTLSFINLFKSALHVSGDKFAHPQERFLTVCAAFGIMHRHCCRSATVAVHYSKAVYTVKKYYWGWANLSPETCRADLKRLIVVLFSFLHRCTGGARSHKHQCPINRGTQFNGVQCPLSSPPLPYIFFQRTILKKKKIEVCVFSMDNPAWWIIFIYLSTYNFWHVTPCRLVIGYRRFGEW